MYKFFTVALLIFAHTAQAQLINSFQNKVTSKQDAKACINDQHCEISTTSSDSLLIRCGDQLQAFKIRRYEMHPNNDRCLILWLKDTDTAFALEYQDAIDQSPILGGILSEPLQITYFYNQPKRISQCNN